MGGGVGGFGLILLFVYKGEHTSVECRDQQFKWYGFVVYSNRIEVATFLPYEYYLSLRWLVGGGVALSVYI